MRPAHSFSRPAGFVRQPSSGVGGGGVAAPAAPQAAVSSSAFPSRQFSGGPPQASPTATARSFDDDFGDGSDLMDVDEVVVAHVNIQTNYARVKVEPTTNPPPPQPAQAWAPPIAGPSSASAPSVGAFVVPASASHPAFTASTAADAARIADLQGEVKVLRSRNLAMERLRANEAAALASRQATSNAANTAPPFSMSQMPSSQQHNPRKQEIDALARTHAQMETLKAQKESTEMQSQEYAKENERLRRKMEMMEKQQQQLMQQLRSKPTSASTVSAAAGASNFALSQATAAYHPPTSNHAAPSRVNAGQVIPAAVTSPSIGLSHPTTSSPQLPVAAPPAASPAIGVTTLTHSPAPRSHIHGSGRWKLPAFIAKLSLRSSEAAVAQRLTDHTAIQLFGQLLMELQLPSPASATSAASSSRQCVKSEPLEREENDPTSMGDRLTLHLISSMQMVLAQTAPLTCVMTPLRQLLLTRCIVGNPAASPITPPLLSPSTPHLASNSSSIKAEPWERSVRVKLEHGPAATALTTVASPPPPFIRTSTASSDTKRIFSSSTSSNSRESKQTRCLLELPLRILHFCVAHDTRCAVQVFDDVCDPPSLCAPTRPTLSRPASFDPWRWQPPLAVSHPSAASNSAVDRLVESMNWQTVLTQAFDDAFPRLYTERADRLSSSASAVAANASSGALVLLELVTSVLQIVCQQGVPRSPDSLTPSVEKTLSAWLPRMTQLIARFHANAALKHPITALNAAPIEWRVHIAISQLLGRWCDLATSPIFSAAQPASHAVVPGHVKLSVAESSSCTCSLLQLLLLQAMRSGDVAIEPLATAFDSAPSSTDLMIELLSSAQRCYAALQQQPSATAVTVCCVHGREWGERETDHPLLDAASQLFTLPFAPFRLLLATFTMGAVQLQMCTRHEVRALVSGVWATSDASSCVRSPIVAQLAAALRVIHACLRVGHRRWKEVLADPRWAFAMHVCRGHEYADRRLDSLVHQLQEGCLAVRQCHQQLKAAHSHPDRRPNTLAWIDAVRLASELLTWMAA